MNSVVCHELITPLKCIVQVASYLQNTVPQLKQKTDMIVNTANLMHSQVKRNLDRNLLERNLFRPNLEPHSLNQIVLETAEMLEMNAAHLGIKIRINGCIVEEDQDMVLIDQLRVQ